jgi:hypothetical protein
VRVAQGQPFMGLPFFVLEEIDLQVARYRTSALQKLRQAASQDGLVTCQAYFKVQESQFPAEEAESLGW